MKARPLGATLPSLVVAFLVFCAVAAAGWSQQIDVAATVDDGACVGKKWPLVVAQFSGDFVVREGRQPRCNFQCASPRQDDGAWFFVIPEQTESGWQATLPEATTCERIEYYFSAVDGEGNEFQSLPRFVEPDSACAANTSNKAPTFVGTSAGASATAVGFSLGSATLATGVGAGVGEGLGTAAIVGITTGVAAGVAGYVAIQEDKEKSPKP